MVLLLVSSGVRAQTIYEAEDMQVDLVQANRASGWGGSSGGYVDYLITAGTSSVTFKKVTVPTSGMYTVAARYAAKGEYMLTMSVYVNGRDVTQAHFVSTAAWDTWATQSVVVPLQAGNNIIAYKYDNDDTGWINLDYMQVSPAVSSGYSTGSAAAAGWFPGEVSVDQFTGTAQVQLPLFTISAPGISLPVALNHAASGVQVNNQGGTVGVNWSLQAGVSIQRLVRGLPDDFLRESGTDKRYGWLRYPIGSNPTNRIVSVPNAPVAIATSGCEQTAYTALNSLGSLKANTAIYDTEPDIFYYSLPGHVGSFVFDEQGRIRTIPYDPIAISINPTPFTGKGIISFTIKTPDGVSYLFDKAETVTQKTVSIVTTPKYFLRDYYAFLPATDGFLTPVQYSIGWHASQITSLSGGKIELQYSSIANGAPQTAKRKLLAGNVTAPAAAEYRTEFKYTVKLRLQAIKSPTTTVTFQATQRDEEQYSFGKIIVTSPLNNDELLKQYNLNYILPATDYSGGKTWEDEDGGRIDAVSAKRRMYLSSISVSNGCFTQPLYDFSYHQTTEALSPLCPPGAVTQDYWGFYNNNKATALIPKLFLYPQLVTGSNSIPAAPYRLYGSLKYSSGGLILDGADRRPAADFNTMLAGTLTEITFATGGKAVLEYEPHQFYDPVAEKTLVGGGVRIRTIKAQDPVTKTEVRRDYLYQADNGWSSGVLIHAPRFAFAVPASGGSTQQQWANASVRSGEDFAFDPFETRAIGYKQVSEKQVGKGEAVTLFQVPGTADEVNAAAATDGVPWSRPVLGVGRQATGSGPCPSVAPVQTGSELYPFPATPNYNFLRGLPQRILYKAEPAAGSATGGLVRQLDFTYRYRNLRPALAAVKGLVYDQLATDVYGYAKYELLTDFLYTTRQETVLTPNQTSTPTQSATVYRYNEQGWLATVATQNSDRSYSRIRYKYLGDYKNFALSSTATEARAQAMYKRSSGGEQISSDVVETISETVTPTGQVRFMGASLNTFTQKEGTFGGIPWLTRPYQSLRWQPALAMASYDSIRLVNDALYVNPGFKPVTTILDTDGFLTPLSVLTETGRKVSGQHMGYGGTLPVLQISNATASEVLFSDFESTKDYGFAGFSTGGTGLTGSTTAARTGKLGLSLLANYYLQGKVPVSTTTSYRLTFWYKATQATSLSVSIPGFIAASPVSVIGNGQWQQAEVVLNLASIPVASRGGSVVKLLANGPLQLDDITFAPVTALMASVTYDLAKGKTSQTDPRGRSTYYEYNAAGKLALVLDHNKSITQQTEQIVAGQRAVLRPNFSVGGLTQDGAEVNFQAYTGCETNLEYAWDFGDGSAQSYSTSPSATHRFNTNDTEKSYEVKLLLRSQGKVYSGYQKVSIQRRPLVLVSCTQGVVGVDDCGVKPNMTEQGCDAFMPASTTSVTYTVTPVNSGSYTYIWEQAEIGTENISWRPIENSNGAAYTYTLSGVGALKKVIHVLRCRVSDGTREAVSEVFGITHYQSLGPQYNCTP